MALGAVTRDYPVGQFTGYSVSLTTTHVGINIPKNCIQVLANGTEAWRGSEGQRIRGVFLTGDAGVTYTDYTSAATDLSTSTDVVLSSMAAAGTGYLYIIFSGKAGGVWWDVAAANGTASALSAYYWNGLTWVDLSATDTNGETCFAADGTCTWTVPAAWQQKTIDFKGTGSGDHKYVTGYPVRFQVVTALDSETLLDSIVPLCDYTTYPPGYFTADLDYVWNVDTEKVGSVHGTTASTATLNLTFICHDPE